MALARPVRHDPPPAARRPATWSPWELSPALRAHMRAVPYRKGTPFAGRVYVIHGWDRWSLPQRLDFLRKMVLEWARDPQIAQHAASILHEAGVDSRQHRAAWAALLRWVQRRVLYVNEPGERLQSPQYTLWARYGDCDDMGILLAALGASLRLPWEWTVSGRLRSGTRARRRWVHRRGPIPGGVEWTHIYLCVGWPPFHPERWCFAEPTLRVPLGWDVISAMEEGKAPLPEMAGAAWAGPGDTPVNLGAFGHVSPAPSWGEPPDSNIVRASNAAASSTTSTAVARSQPGEGLARFVRELPWGTIVATALPTVLSFVLIKQLGGAAHAAPTPVTVAIRRNRSGRRRRRPSP